MINEIREIVKNAGNKKGSPKTEVIFLSGARSWTGLAVLTRTASPKSSPQFQDYHKKYPKCGLTRYEKQKY